MHSAVFPTLYLLNGEYDDCLATREMAAVLASNRVQENLPKIAKQSSYYVTIKSSDAICIVVSSSFRADYKQVNVLQL